MAFKEGGRTKLGLRHRMHFGKFEGVRVCDIIEEEPDYIRWCSENLDKIYFSDKVKRRVEDELELDYYL